ncbi:MAG: flagellar hook-length control protein FliK [Pseudomonadota bacterium]
MTTGDATTGSKDGSATAATDATTGAILARTGGATGIAAGPSTGVDPTATAATLVATNGSNGKTATPANGVPSQSGKAADKAVLTPDQAQTVQEAGDGTAVPAPPANGTATTRTADAIQTQPNDANAKQQAADAGKGDGTTKDANAAPVTPTGHHPQAAALDPSALPADAGQRAAAALQVQHATPNVAATPVAPAGAAAVPLSGVPIEIAAQAQTGRSRFEIRLDPPELGRIDVRLDVDKNGQVTSHLTVDKVETLNMLQKDAPHLQRALEDAGLKTGDSGLQFSLRDQSSSSSNGRGDDGHSGRNPQRLVIQDDDTTIPAQVAGRSYGRALGAAGGVDIRV